jgi:VanZ family protein
MSVDAAYHRRVRRALSSWGPVAAWAGLIFALSSIPDLGTGLGGYDLALRKLAHAGEYAVLALLLLRALGQQPLASLLALLLASAYAASDELHQHFVPGRQAAILDVAVDAAGALVGLYLGRWLLGRAWA